MAAPAPISVWSDLDCSVLDTSKLNRGNFSGVLARKLATVSRVE